MNSPPDFNGVCVAQYLVFCVMFCGSLFVFSCFFFFWPQYHLIGIVGINRCNKNADIKGITFIAPSQKIGMANNLKFWGAKKNPKGLTGITNIS
jgi:hypothetical protein